MGKTQTRGKSPPQEGEMIHCEWGATWLDLGRLRLVRCAPRHPNKWMLIWRRKRLPLPEIVEAGPEAEAFRLTSSLECNEIEGNEADQQAKKVDINEIAARLPAIVKIKRDLE